MFLPRNVKEVSFHPLLLLIWKSWSCDFMTFSGLILDIGGCCRIDNIVVNCLNKLPENDCTVTVVPFFWVHPISRPKVTLYGGGLRSYQSHQMPPHKRHLFGKQYKKWFTQICLRCVNRTIFIYIVLEKKNYSWSFRRQGAVFASSPTSRAVSRRCCSERWSWRGWTGRRFTSSSPSSWRSVKVAHPRSRSRSSRLPIAARLPAQHLYSPMSKFV